MFDERRPSVAVIIPTRNREEPLIAALRSVSRQSLPPSEIVVVDSSQRPLDRHALADRSHLDASRLIYDWFPTSSGLTMSRNRGASLTGAEIVQFMDDDCTIAHDYLARVLPHFEAPEVGGVGGSICDPSVRAIPLKALLLRCCYTGPFRQRKEELAFRRPLGVVQTNTLAGASAYRRSIVCALGFDERITSTVGEDIEFAFRAGVESKLLIDPSARMTHRPSPMARQSVAGVYSDKAYFFYYHFRKNMTGRPSEWLSYLWLNVGMIADGMIRGRGAALRGFADAWRRIRRHDTAHAYVGQGLARPRPSGANQDRVR